MYRFLKAASIRQIAQNASKVQRLLIVSILLLVGGIIWFTLFHHNAEVDSSADTSSGPDYATILPEKKTIDDLGGWTRVSPDNADPVYAYIDTINNVSIRVSQQPIPSSFENNIESRTKEMAVSFGSTSEQEADDATRFYIGTNAKGPQSVVFTKDSLLVLITSKAKISDASWKKYIASLSFN